MANIFGADEQKLKDAHLKNIRKSSNSRVNKISASRIRAYRDSGKKFDLNNGRSEYNKSQNVATQYDQSKFPNASRDLKEKEEEELVKRGFRRPIEYLGDDISSHSRRGVTSTEDMLSDDMYMEGVRLQKQQAQQRPQQKPAQRPIKRENAPVIDFGRLAEKGYLSEQRSNNPGENMPDPTAKSEEPPVRRGKDLLYSKARERNPEELTEQAPIKEPVQETKAPNYDDMWANASDDDKAAFAEFMAQRNK